MRTNNSRVSAPVFTHEGGKGAVVSPELTLRRLCMSALLFEKQFYQSGDAHSKQVIDIIQSMEGRYGTAGMAIMVGRLAVECRSKMYLRHMPLFLIAALTRYKGCGSVVANALSLCIQRPDELGEFVAIYSNMYPEAVRATTDWRTGRPSGVRNGVRLSAGAKRGLAAAFRKFSEYSLAKYDRDTEFTLRDVMRLVKPKPVNTDQGQMWKRLLGRSLATPDTWEVRLSAGGNKRDVFERLLVEGKMGGLAFLRNLRNMQEAGVSRALMVDRFKGEFNKVFPYRFLAAMKYAPSMVSEIDEAMLRRATQLPKVPGRTALLVDVSGSMNDPMSTYSEMRRLEAACSLATLVREASADCQVFTFSQQVAVVPSYRGLALSNAIVDSQPHRGTFLRAAMDTIGNEVVSGRIQPFDRVIVITDEQSADGTGVAQGTGYIINVGADSVGVGYPDKGWVHIDGFSERVMDFIYINEGIEPEEAEEETDGR